MQKFVLQKPYYKYLFNQCMLYHDRPDQLTKRGLLLEKMVVDKDKRKHWHLNIMSDKAKCRNVFEKVHKPSRRRNVLNSLFIKNITEVMATGEIVPEVLNYEIEITGVKISPCCKILNVFWQIPARHFEHSSNIGELLTIAAPKIRAELISRNVLGRMPYIYFLRDSTNARVADFEEALAKLDVSSDSNYIITDDSFVKDIYSFKTSKDPKIVKENSSVYMTRKETEGTMAPQSPHDMKADIFGLDREKMMERVLALKKKEKKSQQSISTTAVMTQEMLEKGDIFSKIPGVCFESDTTREKVFKQFEIERKIRREKKIALGPIDDDCTISEEQDFSNVEYESYEEDYLEEDVKDI